MKNGFKFIVALFLRNIVIPLSSVMIFIWLTTTLFADKGITHLEVLATGLIGIIVSVIIIRKL
jgi:hypothetical protein